MNVERWVAGRQIYWQRLEDLLKQIEKRSLKSLSREDLQSLGRLYRSAASDLSRARAMGIGNDIIAYLNNLVVKGHNQVYQSPRNRLRDLWIFLWITFPENFRNNIVYVLISFTFFAIPLLGTYSLVVNNEKIAQMEMQRGQAIVSDELWSYIDRKKMWTDSIEGESPLTSTLIAGNNIKVSMLAFVFGVSCGLGTIYVLVTNGISLGGVFAVCHAHGMGPQLLTFVASHGIFELSAIFISGGAGLMLAKGMLFPGEYKRSDSLKIMAKQGSLLFLGCVPLLLIAGCIEGFISPRTDLAPEAKFFVSIATLIIILLYLFVPRRIDSEKNYLNESCAGTEN